MGLLPGRALLPGPAGDRGAAVVTESLPAAPGPEASYSRIVISTRRLRRRPSSVALLAAGRRAPNPR